jgi:(p)ppGpp synthase/HD superfamily hydrolase
MDIQGTIWISAKDRNGLVCEIASEITKLDITITYHKAKVYNNHHRGMLSDSEIRIRYGDPLQLETLLRRLRKIPGVVQVRSENKF